MRSAIQLDRGARAEEALGRAAAVHPSADVLVTRALLYWNTNRAELALADLESAARLDPRNTRAYLLAAEIQSAAGDFGAARKLLARSAAVARDGAEATGLAAEIELKEGRHDRSLLLADAALREDPRETRSLEVRALSLVQLGHTKDAREAFTKLLEVDAESSGARNNAALFELQQGDLTAAARLFKDAVDLDPSNAMGYRGLKEAATKLGRADLVAQADRGLARLGQ